MVHHKKKKTGILEGDKVGKRKWSCRIGEGTSGEYDENSIYMYENLSQENCT